MSLNLELMLRRMANGRSSFIRSGEFHVVHIWRAFPVAAAVALSASAVLPAVAVDLVGGYYPPAARGNRHYFRTTYANEKCGLLKVTQSEQSRIVRICTPILNLKPNPTRGTSSGDAGDGSSYTVTQ